MKFKNCLLLALKTILTFLLAYVRATVKYFITFRRYGKNLNRLADYGCRFLSMFIVRAARSFRDINSLRLRLL